MDYHTQVAIEQIVELKSKWIEMFFWGCFDLRTKGRIWGFILLETTFELKTLQYPSENLHDSIYSNLFPFSLHYSLIFQSKLTSVNLSVNANRLLQTLINLNSQFAPPKLNSKWIYCDVCFAVIWNDGLRFIKWKQISRGI